MLYSYTCTVLFLIFILNTKFIHYNQLNVSIILANLDDLSGLLQNSSQPVNIPGSQLNSISGTFLLAHHLIENRFITFVFFLIFFALHQVFYKAHRHQ